MSVPASIEQAPGLRRIAIVGDGCAGWMAAAMLAPLAASGTRITLIDAPAERDLPSAAVLLPGTKAWHALLGIEEHALLAESQGSYRLGTRFSGWPAAGDTWLLPFGDYGSSIDGIAFPDLWFRARAGGWPRPLEDYNLAALAAAADKFVRPTPDRVAMLDYGHHVDRAGYAGHMRRHAEHLGVETVSGGIAHVARGAHGAILAVHLHSGGSIEADFFVDASDRGDLIGGFEGAFEEWSGSFASNRIACVAGPADPDLPPVTGAQGIAAGWIQRVPLQTRTDWMACFAAEREAEAIDALTSAAGGAEGLSIAAVSQGRRARPWIANCIAIGRAAGALEPLFADPIDVARSGLSVFRDLLPRRNDMTALAQAYNDAMAIEWETLRDISALLAPRAGPPSPTLARKIELFRTAGRLPQGAGTSPAIWLAALMGRGILPQSCSPLADAIGADRLEQNMIRLASLFAQSAEAMPRHADYVARFCKTTQD
ncbi:MAG: tryptophan 7-halogenase [Sphingomonas sp.]